LQVNSCSIDQESGGIWTVQANLQQISFKSDSLLDFPIESDCHPNYRFDKISTTFCTGTLTCNTCKFS
jgi:hypothetical protein